MKKMVKALILSIGGPGAVRGRHKRTARRALKGKGSFTRYCNKKGHKGASKACIKSTMKNGTKRRKRQARATANLIKHRHRKLSR